MGEFGRRTVSTIWHYHCGCVVGRVVDREYRVTGVSELRLNDGSTFSVSPGTNPQATLMMMGRYMGRKISEDRREMSNVADRKGRNRQPHPQKGIEIPRAASRGGRSEATLAPGLGRPDPGKARITWPVRALGPVWFDEARSGLGRARLL
ncbi:uncharacterized protein A4U43_C08F30290 [Asparagus officinalis]|nr:uncharacterized protein A4U43_C08F30290 [Asparagus officinalis]